MVEYELEPGKVRRKPVRKAESVRRRKIKAG
jgi:hypothetical protein